MKKSEAEPLVRAHCSQWKSKFHPNVPSGDTSVNAEDFVHWLRENHAELFGFRSRMGSAEDIERWAIDELGQRWRY